MRWQETSSAVSGEVEAYRCKLFKKKKKRSEERRASEAIVGKTRVKETHQKIFFLGGAVLGGGGNCKYNLMYLADRNVTVK